MRRFKREGLSRADERKLREACASSKQKLVVWTLLGTGLRVAEFVGLKSEDLRRQEHRLRVVGKGKKIRIIPLLFGAEDVLLSHFQLSPRIGMTARTARRIVHKVAEMAGINRSVFPHILRHTYALRLIEDRISVAAVQKILGHDHLETTAIYLNMSNEEACREATEKARVEEA